MFFVHASRPTSFEICEAFDGTDPIRTINIVNEHSLIGGIFLLIMLSVFREIIELKDEITIFIIVNKFNSGIISKPLFNEQTFARLFVIRNPVDLDHIVIIAQS